MTMLDSVLSADVLQHCGERAPIYDRDNTLSSSRISKS